MKLIQKNTYFLDRILKIIASQSPLITFILFILMQILIALGCRLDQLLNNLIIVSILAINIRIILNRVIFHLKQRSIKNIYFFRVGSEHLMAVLVHPTVENTREEIRISSVYFLFVFFY